MSPFIVLVLCLQACLIQTVMSQYCGCGSNGYSAPVVIGYSAGPSSCDCGGYSSGSSCGGYGGKGTGEVSVAGDIQACGTTCVKGSVPVLGSVDFAGCVGACGTISVCGQCGCGCA